MELHDQIRVAREKLGWDQQTLADKMGVSKTSVANWESGATPRTARLKQLQKVLNTRLYVTGTPTPETSEFSADEIRLMLAISRLPLAARKAIEALVEFKALVPTKPREDRDFEFTESPTPQKSDFKKSSSRREGHAAVGKSTKARRTPGGKS